MKQSEVDKIITKIEKNVTKAYDLLKEASSLSEKIDFNELKDVIDINKYEDSAHIIAQSLSFMSHDPRIGRLEFLFNRRYGEILGKESLKNK